MRNCPQASTGPGTVKRTRRPDGAVSAERHEHRACDVLLARAATGWCPGELGNAEALAGVDRNEQMEESGAS